MNKYQQEVLWFWKEWNSCSNIFDALQTRTVDRPCSVALTWEKIGLRPEWKGKNVKNWSRKTGIRWLTHRFYPLQTASSTDINTSHHVKQHCHNHGRYQEPWIYNQIYDDDGQVLQETLQWIRGKLVDRLESRKQPTNRKLEMCVGYLHRRHRTGHLVAMNQHCRYRERTDWEFVRSGCYWRRSFWFV